MDVNFGILIQNLLHPTSYGFENIACLDNHTFVIILDAIRIFIFAQAILANHLNFSQLKLI